MNIPRKKIGDIVNCQAPTILLHATIQEAANIVSTISVSDLMVIDKQRNFIGALSEGDLIRFIVPNFEEIISLENHTLAMAYEAFVRAGKDAALQPIDRLIIRNAITLNLHDELLNAAIVMLNKQIRCLPVVENNKFIGTVSRADICRAILKE
jgi:CBS domain-containing protein